ncbi:SMC-Scp complex subunit ScpB [Pirellulaceae bacterium]|jgi:segregation and condensation protein B|nr:SMC-Scp complex subunit ScpB [Pirellulaceae bacterium]
MMFRFGDSQQTRGQQRVSGSGRRLQSPSKNQQLHSSKVTESQREFKSSFFRQTPNARDGTINQNGDGFEDGIHDSPKIKMRRVEAVLFISREPLNTRQIAKLAHLTDGTEARSLIAQINVRNREAGRAFSVEKIAGGYQFLTKPQVVSWVRRLHGVTEESRLSEPAMETLSIIGYRQPVVRADVEQIRGVSCGEVLRQLMERKFIKISGRSEELGRPFLYTTTKYFLKYFGIDKLEDLPKSDYFRKNTDGASEFDSQDILNITEDYA